MRQGLIHELIVSLGERSYPIEIGAEILSDASRIAAFVKQKKVMIVSNETVASFFLVS